MGKGRFKHICISCGKEYFNKDVKGKHCFECKNTPVPCKCGCGRMAKSILSPYILGHRKKGKTYKEIYGTNTPKCGFKKGLQNPNYTSKRFQCFKLKYPDSKGKLFRSTLEAKFSEFCYKNNLEYEYEKRFVLSNSKVKVIDFIVNNIFIEITGYAYSKWQKEFDEKLELLRETYTNPIILLTYEDKVLQLLNNNRYLDVFVENIEQEERIWKKISMFTNMQLNNRMILTGEKIPFNKFLKYEMGNI